MEEYVTKPQGVTGVGGVKKPLIVIAGPTAVGKSEIAAELGKSLGGEVVSADSMQVYRYMDIGSAKVTLEEMMGVPHHMIDVVNPDEEMDAARYARMASECIRRIHRRGRIPILAGGTGFYIQAVAYNIHFENASPDETYRKRLRAFADENGRGALHRKLEEVDPDSAKAIHPNNLKRVIRALEYYHETGEKISDHNRKERERKSPYELLYFVITDDRKTLYQKIDSRVDFMVGEGLVDEVRYLKAMGLTRDNVSMQGLGYKEILDALDGKMTQEEAVRKIKLESRHYAKRQITWFKREKDAIWIDRRDFDENPIEIRDYILKIVRDNFR